MAEHDMEQYRMRCAECGVLLTEAEGLAWLMQWRKICQEVDTVEAQLRAEGYSARLYNGLAELVAARWYPPCDRCRPGNT